MSQFDQITVTFTCPVCSQPSTTSYEPEDAATVRANGLEARCEECGTEVWVSATGNSVKETHKMDKQLPAPHAATHICDLCTLKAEASRHAEEIKGLQQIIAQQSAAFRELEAERDRLAGELSATLAKAQGCVTCENSEIPHNVSPCDECDPTTWTNWTPKKAAL